MAISVRNDIASIVQYDSKLVIAPHNDTVIRTEFDKYELTAILALYSSYLREKDATATIKPFEEVKDV